VEPKLVRITPLKTLLSQVVHPHRGIKDIYLRTIEEALDISNSPLGIILIHSPGEQVDDTSLSEFKYLESVNQLKQVWQASRGWTDTTRIAADNWLKEIAGAKQMPHILARSRAYNLANSEATVLDLMARCPATLWIHLTDGNIDAGWLGLGSDKGNAYSASTIGSLEALVSAVLLGLNRIFLREHGKRHGFDINMVGDSPEFLRMERELKQAARQNQCAILIRGERGSGKELAAFAIHYFSKRKDKPFIPVLAAAFTEGLQFDELFGHERYSYTGATSYRKGKFLAADGGTIFLDEVADLSETLQLALLRVLDRGEVQPIGRDFPIKVDVRVVAATNGSLEDMVTERRFRADLYDRLNVIKIDMPPLRERPQDIPSLAGHFLLKQCVELNRRKSINRPSICHRCDTSLHVGCARQDFYDTLSEHGWPGNVRELRNLIIRLTTMSGAEILDPGHLSPFGLGGQNRKACHGPADSDLALDKIIRAHIEKVLEMADYNQTQAASLLGIARTTLQAKMKKLNIKGNISNSVGRS
jgi:DNA-binding NtrC family response regulator